MAQAPEINLGSPSFKANPYPAFAQLRTSDPIHRIAQPGGSTGWLVTRYKDADMILRDGRFVKDIHHAFDAQELENMPRALPLPRRNFMNLQMLSLDPPDHTRLRALINIPFTPRLIERWRGRVQEITDELIDAVQDKGEMDLIDDFAFPLPMRMISEILGVPSDDYMKFRTWSNLIVDGAGNLEVFKNSIGQLIEFYAYLRELIAAKRQTPADDLLSMLIQTEEQGDKFSEEELVAMVFLLIVAGHETTVNLIGNGMLVLLQHPDQLQLLKQQPELIKSAVEEVLRYRGPLLLATQRWVGEDLVFQGQQMQRGDYVMLALSSANRDEEEFVDPDTLDITREENRHLAFGKGIHYCLGAPLARLEGQITIGTLVRRLPNLRLKVAPEELIWRPGNLIMGLSSLPVEF